MEEAKIFLQFLGINALVFLVAVPGLLIGKRVLGLNVASLRLVLVTGSFVIVVSAISLLAATPKLETLRNEMLLVPSLSAMLAIGQLAIGTAIAARSFSWKVAGVAAFGIASQIMLALLYWLAMAVAA
jgi:hypothetical protein